MFKHILLPLLLCVGLVMPAAAGTNLKQNADGSASWVDTKGNAYPVREVYLTTRLSNVSSSNATAYVISPVTNVKISAVRAVVLGQITGSDAVLSIKANGTLITPQTFALTTQGVSGAAYSLGTVTSGHQLEAGQVISISTNGASTNAIEALITVTLSPRN